MPASRCAEVDQYVIAPDPFHAFPRDSTALGPRGQPLDQAARTAHQRDDPAAVTMDLMHAAEPVAALGSDRLVAKAGEADHIAPPFGIHAAAAFSLLCRPRLAPLFLR